MWKWIKKHILGIGEFASIKELAEFYRDKPAELGYWIQQKVVWTSDPHDGEIMEEAESAFGRGIGDCWDMACLAHVVLRMWGWKTYILSAWPKDENQTGHSVCVFKRDGELLYFSNGYLCKAINPEKGDLGIVEELYSDCRAFEIDAIGDNNGQA